MATREAIREWARGFDVAWSCGLEATICSHWIYEQLKAYATQVRMANPAKLKAIATAKRKNDALDARTLADLLRCNLFPACYVPPLEYESLLFTGTRVAGPCAGHVQEQERGPVDPAGRSV